MGVATHPTPRPSWFLQLLARPLIYVIRRLPSRSKRLIFLASIMGILQQVRNPDMVLVNKLNQILHIANNPGAMEFPMYIKSVIWRDIGTQTVILRGTNAICVGDVLKDVATSDDYREIGQFFAQMAPPWLAYSSLDQMCRDVSDMIRQIKQYQLA